MDYLHVQGTTHGITITYILTKIMQKCLLQDFEVFKLLTDTPWQRVQMDRHMDRQMDRHKPKAAWLG